MSETNYPSEKRLKQLVKQVKKEQRVKIHQAYDLISQSLGHSSWRELKPIIELHWKTQIPSPQASLNFINDEDVTLSDDEINDIDKERSVEFDKSVKELVEKNKIQLARLGVEYSIFEPTLTGLKKSILDATQPVRTHFELENFHYYYSQSQGSENKVVKTAYLLTADHTIPSRASFYRPKTKKGDPRMWFRNLGQLANAGDLVAIIIFDEEPYLINISDCVISEELENLRSPIGKLLKAYVDSDSSIADELLGKLKALAIKPFKALRKGDTAIGYTLETLLGIEANSSKLPDYKGIELKAGRGGKNRSNLFAQVAKWDISPCQKSAEILDKYGYQREDDFKLYCTVSTQKSNSQGLYFKYDKSNDQLQEWHDNGELVAVWPGHILRERLLEKHAETFWIEADSYVKDGIEHFQLKSVIHTKKPLASQLLPLLENGVITMDHLIKRDGKNNRVSEKGPLFKIDKKNLNLLFPEPVKYSLNDNV
tara:strand:- start:43612 stop:45060 length:1449 start_codon:yes stop_codon:yes gene_type:complete